MQVSKALVFVIWMGNRKMKAFTRAFRLSNLFPEACEVTMYIYSFNKHSSSIQHMLGTILGTRETAVNYAKSLPLQSLYLAMTADCVNEQVFNIISRSGKGFEEKHMSSLMIHSGRDLNKEMLRFEEEAFQTEELQV